MAAVYKRCGSNLNWWTFCGPCSIIVNRGEYLVHDISSAKTELELIQYKLMDRLLNIQKMSKSQAQIGLIQWIQLTQKTSNKSTT